MRAEQTSRSQVWTGLPLSPEQGPPREIKKAGGFMSWQRGLINMNSLFLKKKKMLEEKTVKKKRSHPVLGKALSQGPVWGSGSGHSGTWIL